MQVELSKDKKSLILTLPIAENPQPSKSSGKTMIVAGTGGAFKSNVQINGAPLTISVNAYIPNGAFVKPTA